MRAHQIRLMTAGLIAAAVMTASVPAWAQAAPRYQFDLPEEDLSSALRDIALQSHTNIMSASRNTNGLPAPALSGSYTVAEALDRLLAQSNLRAEAHEDGFIIRALAEMRGGNSEIVVTGSRIAGAPVASSVITIGRATMLERGYSDLGAVVRDIPQSFGGGQNPGLGYNVPANRGGDVGGGSSLNLRGLGSDATLTLLDGHRVAYTAVKQSVDISAIPLGLVDHIDIVPDGASALYGSDAVAGVANVVLRRDMKGLETSTRIGGATDGGDFQQQYGAAAGDRWKSGGFIVAYDRASSDPVWGRQRSWAKSTAPDLMLMPKLWHDSVAFNGHQALTDHLTLETNAYYNSRDAFSVYPSYIGSGVGSGQFATRDQVWGLASTLRLRLENDWRLNLAGTIGKEHVDLYNIACTSAGVCSQTNSGFYSNAARTIELNGNGKLADLPGGPLKLAVGAGYRAITFRNYAGPGSLTNIERGQDSSYGFGELAIPLVGADQDIPFIRSLNASAAVRYERYPGVASVATPKLGLIYAPNEDVDIKASWGKSFRAPTLYEQYQVRGAYVYPATSLGASGYPANAQVIYVLGGSASLKPERANTWSAGVTFHPRAVPGARLEVSYYNIHYRDRIVTPITVGSQALSNPIYQSQVTMSPDAATQAAVIASAARYLNVSAYPYETANVVAIVNNATVNAGHQWIQGIDILAGYDRQFGQRDHLTVSADVVYIDSKQQLSASQPVLPLSGTIFNPPHWRGQAYATWKHDDLTTNLTAHYTGSLIDNRSTTSSRLPSMMTFDATIGYAFHRVFGPLQGVVVTFSAQNMFNAKPTQIATTNLYDAPFDSTNYSPFGRVLSFGVNTKW